MHLFADTGKIIDKFFRLNQIVIYQTEDGQTQIRKTRSHIKIWIKQAFLSKTILFTPHLDKNLLFCLMKSATLGFKAFI